MTAAASLSLPDIPKAERFCVNLHNVKTALLCLPLKMSRRTRVPLDLMQLLVYNKLDKVYSNDVT